MAMNRRALALALLAPAMIPAGRGRAEEARPAKPASKPTANRPDEPLAEAWSASRAVEYLDGASSAWLDRYGCAACHTNYPYLMAGPSLAPKPTPGLVRMRAFLENRVAHWDDADSRPEEGSEGITEVVATATALAFHDAQTTRKLHPLTRKALDRVWTVQRPNGSWDWNKHRLPPVEYDDYFGAVFAAVGVGVAPEDYARTPGAREGVALLRKYLRDNPPPDLHHKAWLLWASVKLDGLMAAGEREKAMKELLALQRDDGGWSLPSLGAWKRLDGSPNDAKSPSDGYATGLILFVLREAGVPAKEEPMRRGAGWLKTHQRVSGRWFTHSLNADRGHYMTAAGTAFAVMALKACEGADR
jgi:squalene-hopene/tetraprenyl-beta-curcumene cyclase